MYKIVRPARGQLTVVVWTEDNKFLSKVIIPTRTQQHQASDTLGPFATEQDALIEALKHSRWLGENLQTKHLQPAHEAGDSSRKISGSSAAD
ncbi:hypothetical protein [Caballeronia sp. LZ043]|uniref:hypothetical protein n=1 Tax=Caballeronia sp. LZ043 TaxID=3038569 RepID=UPI002859B870|nr:hypothetical protein [Caballeronia sp. LZ043]MDR5826193.1 hypothetical protein [Caballeronia sp. LZ043]